MGNYWTWHKKLVNVKKQHSKKLTKSHECVT